MATRSVEVKLSAQVDQFTTKMSQAASAVEAAQKRQTAAIARLEAAQRRALETQNQLGQAQAKYATGSDRHTAAEKRAADALTRVKAAEDQTKTATDKLAKAQDKATEATEKAAKATAELEARQKSLRKRIAGFAADNQEAWSSVSTGLLAAGAAMVAVTGTATKAAIDWESAFAGVRKTTDATEEEYAALADGIRAMSREMPTAVTEIAGVAEAAGQLGVKKEDLLGFTKTMVQLGDTTNMTAQDAAMSLSQFMNIMGTTATDVSRLGATIVDLGNNSATTERSITEMGQRVAGAGRQVGLSEAQVMAFAAAVASTGIEVEAGGTAMAMTFNDLARTVRGGGDNLEVLAKTAGMTAAEYKTAWGTDAAGATEKFIAGLGRMGRAGGDINGVLVKLGVNGERQADTIRRLASTTDKADSSITGLAGSLRLADTAWGNNTALADEAAKRYETNASKIAIAWNQIKDAAIDAGAALAPIVAGIAQTVAGLVTLFAALPTPIQAGLASVVALAGGLALFIGGAMKAVTAVNAAKAAIIALMGAERAAAASSVALSVALQGVKAAAGPVALALTALFAIWVMSAASSQAAKDKADAYAAALRNVGTSGRAALVDLTATNLAESGALEAAKEIGISLDLVTEAALGSEKALNQVNAQLANHTVTETYIDEFGGLPIVHERLSDAAMKVRDAIKAESDAHQTAMTSLQLQDEATGKATSTAGGYASATSTASQEVERLNAAIESNVKAMQEQADMALGASNSEIAYQQAKAKTVELAAKAEQVTTAGGTAINLETQAGREAQSALNQMAAAHLKNVDALQKSKASALDIAAATSKGRNEFIAAATAMGLSEGAATKMADAYRQIPSEVQTTFDTPGIIEAITTADGLKEALDAIPAERRAEIVSILDSKGVDEAKRRLSELRSEYRVKVVTDYYRNEYGPGGGAGRAYGGIIFGSSPHKRADNIPAMLTAGEYVHQVDAVKHYGLSFMDAINRRLIPRENLPRFATGGPVYAASAPTATSRVGDTIRAGGTTNTVNVVNHYPKAEPSSVTVNRALALMSTLGG